MPAAARPQHYDTHFYCALCGGPFAEVFRTAVAPAGADDRDDQLPDYDPADEDPKNDFNKPAAEDRVVPEEAIVDDMGHAARRARESRLRAEDEGRRRGVLSETRTVRQAYDGRLIATRQMKWLRNLRALINRGAKNQPTGYEEFLEDGQQAYLTGRGLIRCDENWADAFPSIEVDEHEYRGDVQDEDAARDHSEYPVFTESAQQKNTFSFHLYQELGREGLEYFVSSIPFHDECWSLLDLAIEDSGNERGITGMNEKIKTDDLWGYLRALVGVGGAHRVAEQTFSLLQGGNRKDVVTRLGEVDYREAQGSGDGWHWKHEDACHWLAADPSAISVRDSPLKKLPQTTPFPVAPRAAIYDPFNCLPAEVVLEVFGLLSSSDIFSLKTASPAVHNVALPESYYRRFLREEFRYLPTLVAEIRMHEKNLRIGKRNDIDWRGSFERLRRLMRTPRQSPVEDLDSSQWSGIDISLKNRNRIWKIVKPMAEELVETSAAAMAKRYGAAKHFAVRTGIVRGYLGTRSGREGIFETAYFGSRGKRRARRGYPEDSDEDGEHHEDIVSVRVKKVRIWTDSTTGAFCGVAFSAKDAEYGETWRRLGRRGGDFVDVPIPSKKSLAGFVLCLSDDVISGAQVVFEENNHDATLSFSHRYGLWNGPVRKIVVPSYWRKFVGVCGFVNTAGSIETLGLLEETKVHDHRDAFGPLLTPPATVELSHEEASLWTELPPANVALLEREGLKVPDWRLCGADWEVWEPGYCGEGETSRKTERRQLRKITGYYDDQFLRGLEFVYEGERTVSVMGCLEGTKKRSINFERGEYMLATVICFGNAGIHGVLFVTDRGRTSEMLGPRYKGTHKVFAPAPDGSLSRTPNRHEIMSKIVGLHCLYDHHSKRFLQLGLMLPQEEDCIFNQPLPRPIPFDEIDDQVAVWTDGPPPKEWIVGHELLKHNNDRIQPGPTFPDFTGWAELKGLTRVTVYGNMKGIKFSWNGQPEKHFGDTYDCRDAVTQEIDSEHGERVVGFAILEDGYDGPMKEFAACPTFQDLDTADEISVHSKTSVDEGNPIRRVFYLTNWNVHEKLPYRVRQRVFCPIVEENLVAMKFDFSTENIISWTPIFAPRPDQSRREIFELVHYPWRSLSANTKTDIQADLSIPDTSHVACAYFEDASGPIDAVKGYMTYEGRFCGLVFRRNGKWSRKIFGQSSGYEVTMELQPGEQITALCMPEINGQASAEAVALCTNFGNTSPWFGVSGRPDVPVQYRQPPPGHVPVGLWGAMFDRPYYFGMYLWNAVGILYRPAPKGYALPRIQPKPPSTCYQHKRTDLTTGLFWSSDATATPDLYLRPLAARRFHHYEDLDWFGRAHCIFDPANLLQIRVCSNPKAGGIRAMRFRGTSGMGLITWGEWPIENPKLDSHNKMTIAGPDGERILRMKLVLSRLEHEDRIIGLVIETSFGRSKTLCGRELYPERHVNTDPDNIQVLESSENDEVVGLHGIGSPWQIHDMGFIIRKKASTNAGRLSRNAIPNAKPVRQAAH